MTIMSSAMAVERSHDGIGPVTPADVSDGRREGIL
jgi:hypothetical protein